MVDENDDDSFPSPNSSCAPDGIEFSEFSAEKQAYCYFSTDYLMDPGPDLFSRKPELSIRYLQNWAIFDGDISPQIGICQIGYLYY